MSDREHRWSMVHPAVTASEQRLMTLVDDVGDMVVRVLGNGPEPHYAEEKLGFALERLAAPLVHLHWSPEVIAEHAGTSAQRESKLHQGEEE